MPYMVTGAHAPRDDANRRCRPFAPVPNPVMGPRTARLRSKLMRGVSVRRHYFCPFWRRFSSSPPTRLFSPWQPMRGGRQVPPPPLNRRFSPRPPITRPVSTRGRGAPAVAPSLARAGGAQRDPVNSQGPLLNENRAPKICCRLGLESRRIPRDGRAEKRMSEKKGKMAHDMNIVLPRCHTRAPGGYNGHIEHHD